MCFTNIYKTKRDFAVSCRICSLFFLPLFPFCRRCPTGHWDQMESSLWANKWYEGCFFPANGTILFLELISIPIPSFFFNSPFPVCLSHSTTTSYHPSSRAHLPALKVGKAHQAIPILWWFENGDHSRTFYGARDCGAMHGST